MKILKRDLKRGFAKVQVEVADDLWYLHTLIDPGDRCRGESEYKEKLSAAGEKSRVARRRVFVVLEVEKTEFDPHTAHLRIAGLVRDGSEEVPRGSHHTLDIAEGSDLGIEKDVWLDYHVEKLEEAAQAANLRTLLVLFDREQAIFAMLKPNGYEKLLELKGDVNKKGVDEQKAKSFYREIAENLLEYRRRHHITSTIAASPSFWKEYLRREIPSEEDVIFAAVSAADESAIPELLKRPELQQALSGERAAREEALLEEALEALGKDKLAYGLADVEELAEQGNVASMLVTEHEIMAAREQERFAELEALMRKAGSLNAKVHLLSTQEAQRKIDGLGGIVAVRRW